jgi:hypothetical protein
MSKRGYVHAHHSAWVEEEEGLIRMMSLARRRRRKIGRIGWDKGFQDHFKWPIGEGWKPL